MTIDAIDVAPWLDTTASALPGLHAAEAAVAHIPHPDNERPLGYAAGSAERARLDAALRAYADDRADLPLVIAGREVRTGDTCEARMPHRHEHVLADVHQAGRGEVENAITACREAWREWQLWPWTERAAVFQRAAALVAGPYRERLTAATMLDQSKTVVEAEADAVCELADFFRFGVAALGRLLEEQPPSDAEVWNRSDVRPLEGFVYSVTPFNFTAIGGNLATAPVLLGNTSIWKPSPSATLAPNIIMRILDEAGLPPGVVNLVHGDAEAVSAAVLAHPDLAGVNFTGSTAVFRSIWQGTAENMRSYRSFPRLVGETGGKGFVAVHRSADPDAVVAAVVRGGFEYSGQKCSAASRLFVPASLWRPVADGIAAAMAEIRVGDVVDPRTYIGAVINEAAFRRHQDVIAHARDTPGSRIVAGGATRDEEGWFVEPTLLQTDDPHSPLLRDELFGPIVTAFVYDDDDWSGILRLIDRGASLALTGSIFTSDRRALAEAKTALRFAAGNLYVNDKPTGAFVGRQPFGGSRASGTNDKTGTMIGLARWASPRTIKETFVASSDLPHRALGGPQASPAGGGDQ